MRNTEAKPEAVRTFAVGCTHFKTMLGVLDMGMQGLALC